MKEKVDRLVFIQVGQDVLPHDLYVIKSRPHFPKAKENSIAVTPLTGNTGGPEALSSFWPYRRTVVETIDFRIHRRGIRPCGDSTSALYRRRGEFSRMSHICELSVRSIVSLAVHGYPRLPIRRYCVRSQKLVYK